MLAAASVCLAAEAPRGLQEALADLKAGRLEPAERKLSLLVQKSPGSADAAYYLGVARFRQRRFREAVTALEAAVRISPSRGEVWKLLGAAYVAQRDFPSAEAPLRQACDLQPQDEDACYYLGRNYHELSRFEEAIAAFEKARPIETQNRWRVHSGLALALEGLHRPEEAERQFRLAVGSYRDRGRRDEDPRIDFGVFLFRQGRAPEAAYQLQQAVSASPDSARARFELGRVLHGAGRLPEAAAQLEKAVELDPKRAEAHLLLAKVYYRLGLRADGDRHLRLGTP